jgi:hypothetical protein
VAGPQGVLVYELQSGWAWDPFARYPIGELYRSLEQLVGQPYRERAPLPLSWQPRKDAPARPLATITGFTPTQITAGTFDTLRIFGSGFGSTPGSVQFPHADYGGSQWFTAPSNHIVLWSDTEIRVIVPTEAGTGNFRVVTSNNETVQSPSALSIPYAVLTLSSGGQRYRVRLVNANSAGGYTLVPNASFAANTDAFNAFKRALQTWRCGTYVNFGLAQTTTTVQCAADDGTNVVSFDNTSCNLPSGVLGVTYNYYGGCSAGGNSYWYRRGMDLIFRRPARYQLELWTAAAGDGAVRFRIRCAARAGACAPAGACDCAEYADALRHRTRRDDSHAGSANGPSRWAVRDAI